ncbi:hypothetical protein JTB14_015763 [Gonioctena quinquepunctata]|nr:hypothetical protein JTB14_015763 [Gonioctena quinquepunctata]
MMNNNEGVLRVMKMNETAFIPTRATFESAGWDIRTPFDLCIPARERLLVDSLLKMKLPAETYGRLAPRSGLALKINQNTFI